MEKKQILQTFIDEKTDAGLGDPAYIFSIIDQMSDTSIFYNATDAVDGRLTRVHYIQVDEQSEPLVHRWKGPAIYVTDDVKGDTVESPRWFILGLELNENEVQPNRPLAQAAFIKALKQGHMFIIWYIVEKLNLRVDTTDALRIAAQYGQLEAVEYIVNRGNAEILPALVASVGVNNDMVVYLYEEFQQRSGNARLSLMFDEPFFVALGTHGDLELINYFVCGGDLNEESLFLLLTHAARRNSVEIVEYLFGYIVQQGLASMVDMTSVMSTASRWCSFEVLEYLCTQTLYPYVVDFWQVINSAPSLCSNDVYNYITSLFPELVDLDQYEELEQQMMM